VITYVCSDMLKQIIWFFKSFATFIQVRTLVLVKGYSINQEISDVISNSSADCFPCHWNFLL